MTPLPASFWLGVGGEGDEKVPLLDGGFFDEGEERLELGVGEQSLLFEMLRKHQNEGSVCPQQCRMQELVELVAAGVRERDLGVDVEAHLVVGVDDRERHLPKNRPAGGRPVGLEPVELEVQEVLDHDTNDVDALGDEPFGFPKFARENDPEPAASGPQLEQYFFHLQLHPSPHPHHVRSCRARNQFTSPDEE